MVDEPDGLTWYLIQEVSDGLSVSVNLDQLCISNLLVTSRGLRSSVCIIRPHHKVSAVLPEFSEVAEKQASEINHLADAVKKFWEKKCTGMNTRKYESKENIVGGY